MRDVVVRSPRLELAGARIDREPDRAPPLACAPSCNLPQATGEVRVDPGEIEPPSGRFEQEIPALGHRLRRLLDELAVVFRERDRRRLAAFERLHERLGEGPPEAERLADGAHLGAEAPRRERELLEVEARRLHGHVVERRLERGRRLLGDVVRQLVEREADREQRGELGDREAGRLRGERRGARDARVHLDHAELVRLRVHRELDIRAARRHADRAGRRERCLAKLLVDRIGERLLGRDRPRVAGVDAHRVEVLDRADDDGVAARVAHHLELVLLPAHQVLLDQHLADGARVQAMLDDGRAAPPSSRRCRRRCRRA